MLPENAAPLASTAERLVFERIRDELPPEWIGLHSVGLTIHKAKPWAEIDFVLVGPPGVFCLEVKGGLVMREDGIWYTTPRYGPNAGKPQRLKESPFEQVGSAAAQLFSFLQRDVPRIDRAIVGYAVATPDVGWTVQGPDVDAELVYDQNGTLQSFDDFMRRVTKWWKRKLTTGRHRELETLGRADKQRVLDAIRGDFQLAPSLRATADLAEQSLVRLTDEQAELFRRLASNPRVIARGGAGTGKTLIAVEEARRLAAEGKTVLYLAFSRNLVRHVSALLADESCVTVRTLHGVMMDAVEAADRRSSLPNVSEDDLMTLFLPELALEVLLEDGGLMRFDAVIIDEGQDLLRETYLDVIEILLGGSLRDGYWRIFLDPNQSMFEGLSLEGWNRVRDAHPVEWPLNVNCRNTAPIATQVSILSGVPLLETRESDGPDVSIHWYSSAEEQREAIGGVLRRLKAERIEPERVVILSRRQLARSAASEIAGSLTDVSRGGDGVGVVGLRFSTISSFKGLEADVVLLVDVNDLTTSDGLASVYVGASRAKLALYAFLAIDEKVRFEGLAREFGRAMLERAGS